MAEYGDLRVPFGERQGRLLTPNEVERGLACGCRCPSCGSQLIANKPKVKRNYFSHYKAEECTGGYETALHRMGKQIIQDAGYVVLPLKAIELKAHVVDSFFLRDHIEYPPHKAELSEVLPEQQAKQWRPDLTAKLKNGKTLFIEIKVTHGVEEPKATALDNLMEIDLSSVSPEQVNDLEVLKELVLSSSRRQWYRCSLYDNLPKVQKAKQCLKEKIPKAKQKYLYQKSAAERQREEEKTAEEKAKLKAIQVEERRERLRIQHASDVQKALKMRSIEAQNKIHGQMLAKCSEAIKAEKRRSVSAGYSQGEDLPFGAGIRVEGYDWIVRAHYYLWQMFILEYFIINSPEGQVFSVPQVVKAVSNRFGYIKWVQKLANLKLEGKKKGRQRGTWYADAGAWFLSPEENRAIKTPYALMLRYLRELTNPPYRLLVEINEGFQFRVLHNQPLDRYRDEQKRKIREVEWAEMARKKAEELNAKRELERQRDKELREMANQKIAQEKAEIRARKVERAKGLFEKGVTDVLMCKHCLVLLEETDLRQCTECKGASFRREQLTAEYIQTYPYRLLSMPVLKS